MRKLLILFFIVFSFKSYSQDINWENYSEINGVIINKGMIDCNGNELLTFEIINTNAKKIIISWYEEVWIDNVCKQDGQSLEHFRKLTLNPEEKSVGSCTFEESFYIGSKINRGGKVMTLTSFSLNNISVEIEK
tara:strand:+ start:1340 stop:1741 length:402 start_codon:yes stop_codon:yes gene_type:complete